MATTEKKNKDKYIQTCLERRQYFAPIVYSANGITRTEDIAARRCVAFLLGNILKPEYLEICSFVRARMSLAIVISNTLILRGARDKEAYILQIIDLVDRSVMELLALWRG